MLPFHEVLALSLLLLLQLLLCLLLLLPVLVLFLLDKSLVLLLGLGELRLLSKSCRVDLVGLGVLFLFHLNHF